MHEYLLTRGKHGIIIYIPQVDSKNNTRLESRYDEIFEYLQAIGIPEVI